MIAFNKTVFYQRNFSIFFKYKRLRVFIAFYRLYFLFFLLAIQFLNYLLEFLRATRKRVGIHKYYNIIIMIAICVFPEATV